MLTRDDLFVESADRWLIGVDLGQQRDYSAAVLLRIHPEMAWDGPTTNPRTRQAEMRPLAGYVVTRIERIPLKTSYVAVIAAVRAFCWEASTLGQLDLIVDAGGPGRPIYDALQDAGLQPIAATAHGGQQTTLDGAEMRASKEAMVLELRELLAQRRLKVKPRIAHADAFKQELSFYEMQISDRGHARYGAPEGQHDDITSAVYLAVHWHQQQGRRPHAGIWGD
jgi:hypothetical protein